MATIKLGSPPKSIKRTVTFPMLDGTEGQIECEFKYRTRREFGEFIQGLTKDAKQPDSFAELMAKGVEANGEYLEQVLLAWDLDEKLSRKALEQLADELPAAAQAILDAYRMAIIEGRLGN